jgi:hypothetical protein
MNRFELRLSQPEDDSDLRKILRENPIVGDISLSFEREPNYFTAAAVEAPHYQIVVGKDLDLDRVVGMGARSIRPLYINGNCMEIGYLSQFRIEPNYRNMRKGLTKAWKLMERLHTDGKSPYYYTSIIEDNLPARRLLTHGLPGLPRYLEYARLHSLAIYTRRQQKLLQLPQGIKLQRGNEALRSEIIACLQRNAARYQFSPHWDANLLFSERFTPGLSPDNFFVALDADRVVGCLALWNQSDFKQIVVRGYSKRLANFRWLINLAGGMVGLPKLPAVHSKIRYAYCSHMAIDEDRPEIFLPLLRALFNFAVSDEYSYFMLGLCENHPFLEIIKKAYAHIDYRSIVYLVTWDKDSDPRLALDDRLPAPEIAIL